MLQFLFFPLFAMDPPNGHMSPPIWDHMSALKSPHVVFIKLPVRYSMRAYSSPSSAAQCFRSTSFHLFLFILRGPSPWSVDGVLGEDAFQFSGTVVTTNQQNTELLYSHTRTTQRRGYILCQVDGAITAAIVLKYSTNWKLSQQVWNV